MSISSNVLDGAMPVLLIDNAVNRIQRGALDLSSCACSVVGPEARVLLVVGSRLDGDVVAFGGFAQGADSGLFAGDVGERVPVIPAHGVFEGHLVDFVIGHIVLGQHLVQLLGRAGPHRVAVRVVGFPADVVDADVVAQLDPDMIGDEAGQEVLAEHLRGLLAFEVLARPRRMHLVGAVRSFEEVGDPARCRPRTGATLRSGYFLIGLDHNRSAAAWTMFIGCRVIITSIGASGAVIASLPEEPMCTFITVSVSTNASHNGVQ